MARLALALVLGGCASVQSVAPGAGPLAAATPGAPRIVVEPIALDGDVDPEQGGWSLTSAWASHLDEALGLDFAVEHASRGQPASAEEPPLLRVRAKVTQRYSVSRTYVLDALSVLYVGIFPLAPSWGEVEVAMVVELDGGPSISRTVGAPHSTGLFGTFRSDEIEAAFRRAYAHAFAELARSVAIRARAELARRPRPADHGLARTGTSAVPSLTRDATIADPSLALTATAAPTRSPVRASLPASLHVRSASVAERAAPEAWTIATALPDARAISSLVPDEPIVPPVFLDPEGFDILTRPLGHDPDGLLGRYLAALGGVEAAAFRGGALVESRTFTQNSADELVGSGEASASGYRFSFYRPPDRTGFFFPPSVGLLWQDVTIVGFKDDIPIARSGDIPAVASDPATGVPVDLSAPLSYDLQLRSGFIGQGLGFNLVAGGEEVQLFFTLQGHVNLVELRYVDVTIGETRVDGLGFVGLRSAGLEGQAGLVFPSAHLAIRGLLQYEWFFDFDFPEPVEFLAATRYNADKDVFERERAFVRGASVQTYNAQIAVAVMF